MSKGILELIRESATGVDYHPSATLSLEKMVNHVIELDKQIRKNQKKGGYLLSKWQAENLDLWLLNWLGENYTVLVSLEVSNIIKYRFAKETKSK